MTRLHYWPAVLGLAVALGGCSGGTTQAGGLELLIGTNLTSPTEFDSIRLQVQQQTTAGHWGPYLTNYNPSVPGEATLPTSFAISAGKSADQVVLIQLAALKSGVVVDLREVQVQVPTNRVAELALVLAESCLGQVTSGGASTCPAGQSCQPATGTCGATTITSALPDAGSSLDTFDASVGAFTRDAGTDARSDVGLALRDSGHDATTDATLADATLDTSSPMEVGTDATSDGAACNPGATECVNASQPATCGPNGTWVDSAACGAHQACVAADGAASCTCSVTSCAAAGLSCNSSSNSLDTCAVDSSGCFYVMSSSTCASGVCVAGACSGSTTGTSNPSCSPGGAGMSDCGAAKESCCLSSEIPGGTFDRAYDRSVDGGFVTAGDGGLADAGAPATVSGFRLDKYAVTVGRFRQFVNGGAGHVPSAGAGKHSHLNAGQGLANSGASGGFEPGWSTTDDAQVTPTDANLTTMCTNPAYATWTSAPTTQEDLPINCVDWEEAYAFCIWDGGFLPSQAESEYAAAGGAQQRKYPWGSTEPGTACPGTGCQYAIYNYDYPSGTGMATGVVNIAPVGTATLGAGAWGQLDLAGNVWGWSLDWYAAYTACIDCADTTPGFDRMFRGGSFGNATTSYLLPTTFGHQNPPTRNPGIGFRCARTP